MREPTDEKPWLSLLLCLTAVYAFNFVQLLFVNRGLEFWFQTLEKPIWTLPTGLIPPVWMVMNGLVGLAAWFGYRRAGAGATLPILLVVILQTVWSWIFFGQHSLLMGLIVLGLVLFALLIALWRAFRISAEAGWLLVPVLVWLGYWAAIDATLLTVKPTVTTEVVAE